MIAPWCTFAKTYLIDGLKGISCLPVNVRDSLSFSLPRRTSRITRRTTRRQSRNVTGPDEFSVSDHDDMDSAADAGSACLVFREISYSLG